MYIKECIPEQSYKTWFSPIVPVRLENQVLTIQVPSQFFYEWLEENYVDHIREAIRKELGEQGRLEYSVVIDNGNASNRPTTVNFQGNANAKGISGGARVNSLEDQYKSPFSLPDIDGEFKNSNLNYTNNFDTYIEGDCNRLARSAGYAVAQKPGVTSFNPLMIYGGVGLGKTHLVQAIGNEIKTNFDIANVTTRKIP